MRYRVDYPVHKRMVVLHVSEELNRTEDAGEFNRKLFERVSGVEHAHIYRFSVQVMIGYCFEAEDVVPGLVETLRAIFPGEEIEKMPDIRSSDPWASTSPRYRVAE